MNSEIGPGFHRFNPDNPPVMRETDPHRIAEQIEAGVAQVGVRKFLTSNFATYLPGGTFRAYLASRGWENKLVVETKPEAKSDPHSDRARTATWRQFFEEGDEAVRVSGIDLQELYQLQNQINNTPGDQASSAQEECCELVLPVYALLREWGWSHRDLTR